MINQYENYVGVEVLLFSVVECTRRYNILSENIIDLQIQEGPSFFLTSNLPNVI